MTAGIRGRAAVRLGGRRITAYEREFVEREHLAAALLLDVDPRIGPIRAGFDALAERAAAMR